jgi:hypothetical protein
MGTLDAQRRESNGRRAFQELSRFLEDFGTSHAERVRRVIAKLESDGETVNAELESIKFCYDEIFAAHAIFDRPGLTIPAYLEAATRFLNGLYYQHYGEFSAKFWSNFFDCARTRPLPVSPEDTPENTPEDLRVARLVCTFNMLHIVHMVFGGGTCAEKQKQTAILNSLAGMDWFVDHASQDADLDLLQRQCGVEARTVIADFVAVLLTEHAGLKEDPSNMRKALDIVRRNAETNPNRGLSKLKLLNMLLSASEFREAYATALPSARKMIAQGWPFTASNLLLKAAIALQHGALGDLQRPDAICQLVDRAEELFYESHADLWLPPVVRQGIQEDMKRLRTESSVVLYTPVNLPLIPVRQCRTCHVRSLEMKRCKICKNVFYCTKECQVDDWNRHKAECQMVGSETRCRLVT